MTDNEFPDKTLDELGYDDHPEFDGPEDITAEIEKMEDGIRILEHCIDIFGDLRDNNCTIAEAETRIDELEGEYDDEWIA